MPSIRRSLTGYFLLLMAATFLAVGLIVDAFVTAANQARAAADEARLRQEHDARCRETEAKFDAELLLYAQSLARELRQEYASSANREGRNMPARLNQLRAWFLPAALSLDPWAAGLAWATTSQRPTLNVVYWRTVAMMQTEEFSARPHLDEGGHPGVFQVHLPRWSRDYRPPVMRPSRQAFEFPLDPDGLDADAAIPEDYHAFSDVAVPGVGEFRRVVYRYPLIIRLQGLTLRAPRDGDRDGRDGGRAGGRPPRSTDLPGLYVQFARPRAELVAFQAEHADKLAADLAALHADAARYRRRFLALLVGVGVAGFLSLFAGSLWIIRRGLRPLDTLSTAVSRVSERDFRLPVAASQLSEDLLPIHQHLTHTLDALRRAFEREKQAVGDISHELRTPLAALRTTLDVALRKPREAEQYKATLTDCREIARQLSRLVDRILTLAALDSGSIAPSSVPTDISLLAAECVAVIRPLAESHGLTFRCDVPESVRASTDPDRLREVMMNLLHNAVEYNRPGGDILLAVRREKPHVRIAVTDSGIGIPQELRTKIFERFYRADASRHATGVHAGLGLAIVKEYLTRLGGTIAVESEPGQGTTFTVTLPA